MSPSPPSPIEPPIEPFEPIGVAPPIPARTQPRQASMAGDYLMAALAQAIGIASAGAVTIVIARWLGPSGRGEYAVLSGAVQLLAMLGQLGFTAGAIQMGSRGAVPPARLVRYAQLLTLASGTVGVLMLSAMFTFRPQWLGSASPSTFAIAAATLPVLLGCQLHTALLFALHRPGVHSRLFILQQLVWVASASIAVTRHPTAGAALGALFASSLVWLIALVIRVRREVTPAPFDSLDRRELGRVLVFGAQSTAGLVMQMATSRVSLFIIGAHAGKAQAGIYSVATVLAETLWQAVVTVAQVNLPRASAAYARGETPIGAWLTSRLATLATLCAALVVAIAAPFIVPLVFGPTFAPAVWPLRLLVGGVGIYAMCLLASADLLARGHPHGSAIASAVTLAITVTLGLALTPRFGAIGAAVATASGYLVATIVLLAIYRAIVGAGATALLVATPRDLRDALRVAQRQLTHITRRR